MPKVLVVEDHTDIRKIIRMVLEQMGSLPSAANGKQGVEAAIREKPDLILMDVTIHGGGFSCLLPGAAQS